MTPTTSTPAATTATSTSEPHKAGLVTPASRPPRLQVRERQPRETLGAYQLQQDQNVMLPTGHEVRAFAGDWVITRGSATLDVLSQSRFEQFYQPVGAPDWILAPADRKTLEDLLGFGATETSASLTAAVSRLARLSIGDIPVNFTVLQWEEIARRAEKRRQPIATYVRTLVDKLLQDLWTSAI